MVSWWYQLLFVCVFICRSGHKCLQKQLVGLSIQQINAASKMCLGTSHAFLSLGMTQALNSQRDKKSKTATPKLSPVVFCLLQRCRHTRSETCLLLALLCLFKWAKQRAVDAFLGCPFDFFFLKKSDFTLRPHERSETV
nr:hypothetical protein [Pandoravirus aubagnensis]